MKRSGDKVTAKILCQLKHPFFTAGLSRKEPVSGCRWMQSRSWKTEWWSGPEIPLAIIFSSTAASNCLTVKLFIALIAAIYHYNLRFSSSSFVGHVAHLYTLIYYNLLASCRAIKVVLGHCRSDGCPVFFVFFFCIHQLPFFYSLTACYALYPEGSLVVNDMSLILWVNIHHCVSWNSESCSQCKPSSCAQTLSRISLIETLMEKLIVSLDILQSSKQLRFSLNYYLLFSHKQF